MGTCSIGLLQLDYVVAPLANARGPLSTGRGPVANDRAPSEESNPSSSMEADGADNTNKRNETWLLALHAVTACCIAVAAPAVMVAIPFIAAPFVASPSASQFFRHETLTCRA